MIVTFEVELKTAGSRPKGLDRIVLPLDGSSLARLAVIPAVELARRTGARLELVSTKVAEGPTEPSSFLDDIADEITDRSSPLDIRTSIRMEADPAKAIQAVVEQEATPALIVMSSHGRGRVRRAVLGSTAELVVAEASAPVLIIGPSFARPEVFKPDGPIVVAHDGDHQPDLEAVAQLARSASGQITILEVFHQPSPSFARRSSGSVISDSAADCASQLRAMGFDVVTEAERAMSTHKVIIEVAENISASYVVVSSRARTGARRAVLGSVASAVVRSCPVPVLVSRSC